MNDKNINIKQEILDKEFTVEYKGYNPSEVDQFLDWLTVYFELLEKELRKLKQQLLLEHNNNNKLLSEYSKLKENYSLLKEQKTALEAKGVENVDIITRLSKLETIVNED
ncbi:MAG: DivIVA domain-containing protein [Spiroplasma sp.]